MTLLSPAVAVASPMTSTATNLLVLVLVASVIVLLVSPTLAAWVRGWAQTLIKSLLSKMFEDGEIDLPFLAAVDKDVAPEVAEAAAYDAKHALQVVVDRINSDPTLSQDPSLVEACRTLAPAVFSISGGESGEQDPVEHNSADPARR